MGLSSAHIGELVRELRALVPGASVSDVQALPPRDLLLVLHQDTRGGARGELLRLRLSADAEAARLHLQIGPVKRHEGPADPFFAEVGKALAESVLSELEQVQDDRVVRLTFRRDGRPIGALVGELTGRHANLILLDGGARVAARLVDPSPATPAAVRLARGAAYALPPGKKAAAAPGPPLAEAFPPPCDAGRLAGLAPLSARVEAALGGAAAARFDDEQRRELVRRIERRLTSAQALVAGLEERARACAEGERVRQDAELLLAHLARIPRGADAAEVPDAFLEGSPPRRIALDPGLSARRNAEKLFARYKKLQRTLARLPEEQALAASAVERLRALLARAAAEDPAELALEAEGEGLLTPTQETPRKPAKVEPRRPYLVFRAVHGAEIRVGRTASDNDRLTFRESRGNDLWLHTADSPGSHVILRLEREPPDDEEVLDAAHLAVHFSPLRGAPRADVHIARRKEVHKPRKAPAGLVTLSGGKVVRLRVEPARLARLLAARGRPGAGPRGPGEGDEPEP